MPSRILAALRKPKRIATSLPELRYLVFQGMKGETGDSAYQVAVENGYVGTEADWLASLNGAPGDPGTPGVSPTVTTESITGGHRVTITDAEHPQGQSFDVMDGKNGKDGGVTEELKQALLACFENVAWINDQGQTYYDALYAALYPPKTLVSISAVFTQGDAVIYDTDSLDTLKQYLTVTATYDDTSTGVVTNYTLSGTLTEGVSTITVLYNGKTTTFNATVTERPAICNLTSDDFLYQKQLTNTSPYYGNSSLNFHRTSYVNFDIPITAGDIKLHLNTTTSGWKFGLNCISALGYQNVQNGQSIANNLYIPGYKHDGDTVTIPETFDDGSAPAYMRITICSEDGKNAIPLAEIISFVAEGA